MLELLATVMVLIGGWHFYRWVNKKMEDFPERYFRESRRKQLESRLKDELVEWEHKKVRESLRQQLLGEEYHAPHPVTHWLESKK